MRGMKAGWIHGQVDGEGSCQRLLQVQHQEKGSKGGGRSFASSVGRSESDSRRGVLLRGVGSGVNA